MQVINLGTNASPVRSLQPGNSSARPIDLGGDEYETGRRACFLFIFRRDGRWLCAGEVYLVAMMMEEPCTRYAYLGPFPYHTARYCTNSSQSRIALTVCRHASADDKRFASTSRLFAHVQVPMLIRRAGYQRFQPVTSGYRAAIGTHCRNSPRRVLVLGRCSRSGASR